jgi:hypothetical protein
VISAVKTTDSADIATVAAGEPVSVSEEKKPLTPPTIDVVAQFNLKDIPGWLKTIIDDAVHHIMNGESADSKNGYFHNMYHHVASFLGDRRPKEFEYGAVRQYLGMK